MPDEVPVITDGCLVFFEGMCDPKRYAKLKDQHSIYYPFEGSIAFDTTGARPLKLERVVDARGFYKHKLKRVGLAVKHLAIFRPVDGGPQVVVDAERLRCAVLVVKKEHAWLGTDGFVYICDRAETDLDLFGEAPAPLAVVLPMNEPHVLLNELHRYEQRPRDPESDGQAGP